MSGRWLSWQPASMHVLICPDPNAVCNALTKVYEETGIWSVDVFLLHSFAHDAHKRLVGEVDAEVDFTQILLLSAVMPMVKALVARTWPAPRPTSRQPRQPIWKPCRF